MPRYSTKLFYKYYKQWIALYKENAIRPVTLQKYYLAQRKLKELAPTLHLNELNRRTYQNLINRYAETHERKTVLDFHHHLRASLVDAVDDGLLEKDPFNNMNLLWASGVDEQVFFYDENGQLINFPENSAWLILSSMNHFDWAPSHTEAVKVLSNGKLYQQTTNPDSTIHDDGTAYEDNTDLTYNHLLTDGGTVFANIQNGVKLRWSLPGLDWQHATDTSGNSMVNSRFYNWYLGVLGTTVGKAPVPTPPTRKTSSVDYHYNVSLANRLNSLIT